MTFYMIEPFYVPNGGYSLDKSLDDETLSNMIESAYWALQAEVEVYDKLIRNDHKDFFIFNSMDSLEKAADILEHYQIQFKTNIVDKTTEHNVDYSGEKYQYNLIETEQPHVDGANNIGEPRIYYHE